MSRSIHQTVKSVFHGKSRAEVNTMCDPQAPDPDVVALQRKSAIKRERRSRKALVTLEPGSPR